MPLARNGPAREAFLRDVCNADPSLRKEVDELLAGHQAAGSFGDEPAFAVPEDAARLALGRSVGAYRIEAMLGAGGMGEVYRARDTKLNRDVALKILPAFFETDPDRVARFKREAHILASLNHPRIAAIYGLEEADGVRALVLELVEGPTLADRLAEGPILPDEALAIADQIAEALEAAHEHGIIHRDIKPSNFLPLFGDRKPCPFLRTAFSEWAGRFSADGRWVAYASNESGRYEVYVAPFPGTGAKSQVSTDGGNVPRWRRDGSEVFYVAPDNTLMAAAVNGRGSAFVVGATKPLFKVHQSDWDVSSDGQRFLVNMVEARPRDAPITIIVNWPKLLSGRR